MAKKVKTVIKLQIPAGKATPAPPVGTALGPHGLNIKDFVDAFNQQTAQMGNTIVPAEITVFEDRSFTFILKTPPASELLKKAANIKKGSGTPNTEKVAKLNVNDLVGIAKTKEPDLTAATLRARVNTIAGTARSMGIDVEGTLEERA